MGLGLDTAQPFTPCVGLSFRRWDFPIYNAERHNASKRSMSKLQDIYMRNLKVQENSEHNKKEDSQTHRTGEVGKREGRGAIQG